MSVGLIPPFKGVSPHKCLHVKWMWVNGGEIIRRLTHTIFHEVTNQDLEKNIKVRARERERQTLRLLGGWIRKRKKHAGAFPQQNDRTICLLSHWKKKKEGSGHSMSWYFSGRVFLIERERAVFRHATAELL